MKDFKAIWKQRAALKTITAADVAAYCVLKAVLAKTNDKAAVAKALMAAAFTPAIKQHKIEFHSSRADMTGKYGAAKRAAQAAFDQLHFGSLILGCALKDVFDGEEEVALFSSLLKNAAKDLQTAPGRYYTYVFVRQDLTLEQQAVQIGHAMQLSGTKLLDKHDPSVMNMVAVGVPDLGGLQDITGALAILGLHYDGFCESDIGDGDGELTALAVRPVKWNDRRRNELRKYDLLKLNPELTQCEVTAATAGYSPVPA